MTAPSRLHSLDNLRAILMWLGIVLHVSVQHVVGESPLPWRDSQTTRWADLVVVFVHSFRMPAFFVLAGFFAALLASRRGWGGMLRHRLRRIGLPLLVFWPPVFAAAMTMVVLYANQMQHGRLGFDASAAPPPPGGSMFNTMHLWFLHLLLGFCIVTAAVGSLARHLPLRLREAAASAMRVLGRHAWGVLVLALPLALAGTGYRNGIVTASGALLPPLAEWVHNGMFFVFGLALHRHCDELLPLLQARCWRHAAAGLVFFVLSGMAVEAARSRPQALPHPEFVIAFVYGCAGWFWSFALIGGFLRYLPRHNAFLQYVSDSSYWVYIVHMVGTIGFGALLYGSPAGALPTMALNIAATTLVGVLTYQLFVRNTVVGVLLNGRRAGTMRAAVPPLHHAGGA